MSKYHVLSELKRKMNRQETELVLNNQTNLTNCYMNIYIFQFSTTICPITACIISDIKSLEIGNCLLHLPNV